MTYKELYEYGKVKLTEAQVEEAALDARLLLEYICHTDYNELLVHSDCERSSIEEQFYKLVIEKRSAHVPLQYITGEQEFMGLCFKVNEYTLIPRQDTETLVENAMDYLYDGMRILDMCTGSGCVLLSLLKYSNECEGIGIDISKGALIVAQENAKRLGIEATFIEGDLFSPLKGFDLDSNKYSLFDMVVANPPYIETAVIDTLMLEVREHEPIIALDGKEDGLYFYRKIVAEAPKYMRNGAVLIFEIGCEQGKAVCALMQKAGFRNIEICKDYTGLDRVVLGIK